MVGVLKSCLASGFAIAWSVAIAADKSFTAADGAWDADANWSPSGVPALGDTAKIPKGKLCRIGSDVTTAYVKTTVEEGGTLRLEGGALLMSDNSSAKQSLTVNGRFVLSSGTLAVHDLTIAKTGRAELTGGSVTVYNNMYNNAATTETTGLVIGQDVDLVKGYWNFNAPGGVIDGLNRTLTEIRVPTSTGGTGTLTITNANLIVDKLGLAYHESNRNNLTGRVDIVKSDVTLKALTISDSRITGANKREVFVGSDAVLSVVGSVGWLQKADESFALQVGGAGVENARLVVTNTSNQAKSITLQKNTKLTVATGGSVTASDVYVKDGGELLVNGGTLPVKVQCQAGGRVTIDGGTVEGVMTCAERGQVTMNGGTLRTATLFSAATDTTDEAYYLFDGGAELYLQDVVVGGSSVNNHAAKETTITPTTMEFRDCALKCFDTYCYLLVGAQSDKNKARVIFDGCRMDPSNGTNYKWYLRTSPNVTCDVIVKGTKNALYFQQIEGNALRLEYVFDGGISPIHLERTGHPESVGPAGHLYLTVKDGGMLVPGDSFDLITSANVMDLAQKDFASTPWSRGDSPWTGGLTKDKKAYRVTLNPVANAAPGSGAHDLEAAKGAGAVSVPVGSTDKLERLDVNVTLDDGTVRTFSYPADRVTPNATNYFVWDFGEMATATSVRVTAKEKARKFYLHFL